MKFYTFTAVFVPEEGQRDVWNVVVPALPGCLSFGESLTEARYNIREALELYLSTLLEEGRPIPRDRRVRLPKRARGEKITVGVEFEVRSGFPVKSFAPYAK